MLSDKTLTCVECGYEFTFTAGEQAFYASMGYTNEPRRCPQCRRARKSQQRGSRDPSGAAREMHQAVCAQCGRDTMVPFLPRGDKPVYCGDCFRSMRFSNHRE
jgi:CxxC-x17-CxxC domain-containing protein